MFEFSAFVGGSPGKPKGLICSPKVHELLDNKIIITTICLIKVLNFKGERAPCVSYVLPGEVVLTKMPGKRDYSRVVVRNPDLPAGVSVEDLDSGAQFSVAIQNLKLINEECLASPVKRFHGSLIKCQVFYHDAH